MRYVLTAFFFLFSAFCFASTEELNLLLNKGDRFGALNLLHQSKKPEDKKLIPLVANQFFKQKTQELSELALSFWLRDRKSAELNVNDALKIEPDNLSILIQKWLLLIEKKECKQVNEEIKPWVKFDTLDVVKLIKARAEALCQSNNEVLSTPGKGLKIFWIAMELQHEIEKERWDKAQALLEQAIKTNPTMPEIYYFKTKINQALKLSIDEPARKYLALCRNITHRQTREFLLQPFLCQRTKDIENLIK